MGPRWYDSLLDWLYARSRLLIGIAIVIIAADLFVLGRQVWQRSQRPPPTQTSAPYQTPQPTPTPSLTLPPSLTPTTQPTLTPTQAMPPTATNTAQPVTPAATATSTTKPAMQTATVTPSVASPTLAKTPTLAPTLPPTPDIVEWRGEYYANDGLTGSPYLVRNDRSVDFNWDYDAPASGLPTDGFSARWTRTLWFGAGTYRFHTAVDDGLRLYVDGALVIDDWADGALRTAAADRPLSAGQHDIRVEYYDRDGVARVRLWWELLPAEPEAPAWRGEYWSNRYLEGTPAVARNDQEIDFDWGLNAPAGALPKDDFSARWTRTIDFDRGAYRFHALSDDGVRLWLDQELLIDAWAGDGARQVAADHAQVEGVHTIRVEYYDRRNAAQIRVWWERIADVAYPDWQGAYWSNRDLIGDPLLVRNDLEIDFDWGDGAPAYGLPVDNFSVRWTREMVLEGKYRFYVLVDDGVRLWVDDVLLIDDWRDGMERRRTAEHNLVEGAHTIRVEFYEHGGEALISVWWEEVTSTLYEDWRGEYWPNRDLEGDPAVVRNDIAVDFDWSSGAPAKGLPADNFSVRWTQWHRFEAGIYVFYASADDAIRVVVDGERILDEWHGSTHETYRTQVALGGVHLLQVEYAEHTGAAEVRFWWQRAGDPATPTPVPTPTAVPTTAPTPTATPQTSGPTPDARGPRLNEVLPAPDGTDWDGDSTAGERDEWIELYNAGFTTVDLGAWLLDDAAGESAPYSIPAGTLLEPGAFLILYGQRTGLVLEDGGDEVRLFKPDGSLADAVVFGPLGGDTSYNRDEAGWYASQLPSPGAPNVPAPAGLWIGKVDAR